MIRQKKFHLDEELCERIAAAAKAERRSQSSFVEIILRRELDETRRDVERLIRQAR